MHMQAGDRLRLTTWGAGRRVVVSLNTHPVTLPAFAELDAATDGHAYDVTLWLVPGANSLVVTLIGSPGPVPFRLLVESDSGLQLLLDEDALLPSDEPWRFWSAPLTVLPAAVPAADLTTLPLPDLSSDATPLPAL